MIGTVKLSDNKLIVHSAENFCMQLSLRDQPLVAEVNWQKQVQVQKLLIIVIKPA